MLRLFVDNLLPVVLAAGAGYVLALRSPVDVRSLSRIVFVLLAPCLIYRVIVVNELSAVASARMAGFAVAVLLATAGLAWAVCRILRWTRRVTAAVVLLALLPNAGNFGLSVNLFAFGDAGLAQAGVFFVASSVITFTLGVLVVSMGRAGLGAALLGLLRLPTLWAVAAALTCRATGWRLPLPVDRTVSLLADACIPLFLIILGMRLRGSFRGVPRGPVILAATLRLAGGAAAGVLLGGAMALEGTAYQVGVIQAAMPSAVICTVLATEYDTEPELVTAGVVVTTLVAPLTLTPLLLLLGA